MIDWHTKEEDLHIKYLEESLSSKSTFRASGNFPDYDTIIDNKKIELKYDKKSEETDNIAIEIYNNRSNKTSGLEGTKALLWSHWFYYDSKWYIGIVDVNCLKKFIEIAGDRFRTINGGDNYNAKLVLIPSRYYFGLCKRFGNIIGPLVKLV